jgi:hypothetical protein
MLAIGSRTVGQLINLGTMMNDKKQILNMLKEEFNRWEELLGSLSEEQITDPHLPSNLSIKDVIAHLWAWQQRSIARMEAAQHHREPEFPGWPAELHPESADGLDQVNAWIYETYHDNPWSSVYGDWRAGYLRFLDLGEAIPEKDLLEPGRYAWLEGEPLSLVLQASYDHHHVEHLEPLLAWLRQNGGVKAAGD